MSDYTPGEAQQIAAQMAKNAKRMKVVAPSPPYPDHQWECNGCTFVTANTRLAEDHAIEKTAESFPHILYERRRGADAKERPRRRIHSPEGRTVRCMERP